MNDSDNRAPSAIRGYLGAWRRQWWIVLGITVLAIVVAALWSSRQEAIYAAQMKIVVGQGEDVGVSPLSTNAQSLTQTMTDLLESDVVADKAVKTLPYEVDPETVLSNLSVSTKPEASVLTITYEDPDPKKAKEILAAVGSSFTGLVAKRLGPSAKEEEEAKEGEATSEQVVSAKVFDPAHELPEKVSPKTKRNIVIAAVLGLLAGLFLALVRDSLSRRLRTANESELAFGAPIGGLLPPGALGSRRNRNRGPDQSPLLNKEFETAYEIVAANIRFTAPNPDAGAFLVTSAMPEEGKTQFVANLARTLARAGRRVVAVEGDLRRPALHRAFQVPPQQPGLTDAIRGQLELRKALIPVRDGNGFQPNLLFLPAGTGLADTHDVFTVGHATDLLSELRQAADYVLVDSAPLLLVPDAYPLAQLVDRVLVIARQGVSRSDEAEAVSEKLGSLGISQFLVVLTDSNEAAKRRYDYHSTAPLVS
ncbi:MAG: hypothetical protein QM729_02650 [Solirubrobacterales bacterium]